MKQIITTQAPAAIGPYAQAVRIGQFLFCSGQIPLSPETGDVVGTSIETQTIQVFRNIDAILLAAAVTRQDVVKTTVYLKDMQDFALMNKVYESYFGVHKPARSTVQVARLPKDVLVEIEVIVAKEEKSM